MYVRETIVFFGYSAQECYLFSSDTGCVPPFQGIHSYFKRADIVVIPKNAEPLLVWSTTKYTGSIHARFIKTQAARILAGFIRRCAAYTGR